MHNHEENSKRYKDKLIVSIHELRKIHSKLILYCSSREIVDKFSEILINKNATVGDFTELQNLMRLELGYERIKFDKDQGFLGYIHSATVIQ